MQIRIVHHVEGALAARGVAIVIDVFRACTVIAHALAAGARRVVPVAEVDRARQLKRAHPDWWLIGERHGRPLPGFDAGNSPTEVLALPLAGRTLIHTTHAGTQGLTAAAAETVFTGAFVNLSATVAAVRALSPDQVWIVAMGHQARERSLEDDLCAEWFAAALADRAAAAGPDGAARAGNDAAALRARLHAAPSAAKFFDPALTWAPEADFDYCSRLDSLSLAVRRRRDPELDGDWVLAR
jgi:2-phosphosulfolactate phosphatase